MWSIGVVMYILLCGFPPFYDDDSTELFRLIEGICLLTHLVTSLLTYPLTQLEECNLEFPCPYFDEISNDAKKLISNLIVKDPSKVLTHSRAHSVLYSLTYLPIYSGTPQNKCWKISGLHRM